MPSGTLLPLGSKIQSLRTLYAPKGLQDSVRASLAVKRFKKQHAGSLPWIETFPHMAVSAKLLAFQSFRGICYFCLKNRTFLPVSTHVSLQREAVRETLEQKGHATGGLTAFFLALFLH